MRPVEPGLVVNLVMPGLVPAMTKERIIFNARPMTGSAMCLARRAFVIASDPFDPIICATHARRMTKF
jgi:hypothetical protein